MGFGEEFGTGTGFTQSSPAFPCQYHSTNAPYSFIHLPPTLYMFFSQHFSFPCQYHSTNAPYSFIHLPPTLYNVFLPALQFPLSVPFHQRSILIPSSMSDCIQTYRLPASLCNTQETPTPIAFSSTHFVRNIFRSHTHLLSRYGDGHRTACW